jgi:hypothetical protein
MRYAYIGVEAEHGLGGGAVQQLGDGAAPVGPTRVQCLYVHVYVRVCAFMGMCVWARAGEIAL